MSSVQAQPVKLRGFLRAARAQIKPEAAGLPARRNRRAIGLRQEDVAALLGVSLRWYHDLENGRGKAERSVLDQLTRVLRLDPDQRALLYLLATGQEPSPETVKQTPGAETVLTVLVGYMSGLTVAAAATDIAWNVLACNPALLALFPALEGAPPGDRNLVLLGFTEQMENIVADIESYRWAHIGWVHLAIARYPDDPRLAHLAERLQRIPEARKMCDAQHVARFTEGVIPVRFRPAGSSQAADADVLTTEVPGGYRLVMIVPRGDGLAGQIRPSLSLGVATR